MIRDAPRKRDTTRCAHGRVRSDPVVNENDRLVVPEQRRTLTGVQHATAFGFGPLVPIDRQAARVIFKR
jgi:hypothetical protein